MPTVTETPRRVFLNCRVPLCAGYAQEEVDGFAVETAYLFTENGGDIPGVERSGFTYRAAGESECPHCGRDREVTPEPRRNYDPLSGFDPMALATGGVSQFDPRVVNSEADARVAELEAQVARLAALVEKAS